MSARPKAAAAPERGFVLVTGASSGIGRELAYVFAEHGHSLLLVARDVGALEKTRAHCLELGAPRADIVNADLSIPGEAERVLGKIAGAPVDVLVHNAGFGVHGVFTRTSLDAERRLVELQIQTPLTLTKGLLPGMIERGRGALLNIASVYSVSPVPRQAVYGACKAFLLNFAEGLRAELEGTGVTVTTVCPGVTQTEFRRRSGIHEKSRSSGMSAAEVARFSYRAYRAGRPVAVPGAINRVFMRAARALPIGWVSGAVARINRQRGLHE